MTRLKLFFLLPLFIFSEAHSQIISTLAGNDIQGYTGDGILARYAEFNCPNNTTVDKQGRVYVADFWNGRIRVVTTDGYVITVAGNGTDTRSGDGGPATAAHLAYPAGVTVDDTGNIYIADRGNARIRKVNTLGSISTVAGDSVYGHTGDGGLADTAALYNPMGVAIDSLGNLYIADFGNEDVRMVTAYDATKVPVQQTSTDELRIWPEPNNGAFSLNMQCDLNQTADFRIVNIEGVAVQTLSAETNKMIPVQLHLPPGNYIVTCIYGGNEKSAKILIQ